MTLCPICIAKYRREFLTTECVCVNPRALDFKPPGHDLPHLKWTPQPKVEHKPEKTPTVRKSKPVKPKEFKR